MKNNDNSRERLVCQSLWNNKIFPPHSGILKEDGTFIELSIIRKDGGQSNQINTVVLKKYPITELIAVEDIDESFKEICTHLDEQCDFHSASDCLRAIGGGGSLGADGFVALVDSVSDKLKWIAFFDGSNPFCEVAINHNRVIAVSSLDECWSFGIQEPEKVTIVAGHPKGYAAKRDWGK